MNAPRDSFEAIRSACIEAALRAYEDAGMRGLCAEGRWELAIQAMCDLDLRGVLGPLPREDGPLVLDGARLARERAAGRARRWRWSR